MGKFVSKGAKVAILPNVQRWHPGTFTKPDIVRAIVQMCRQAVGMVQRDGEKRLLLGTLGKVGAPEALALIVPYLEDRGVRREAGMAAVTLAGGLLRGRGPSPHAGKLIVPLEKVVQADVSADITRRARDLVGQARTKAGQN